MMRSAASSPSSPTRVQIVEWLRLAIIAISVPLWPAAFIAAANSTFCSRTPVLIAVGVEDEHGWWRSGLQMMRGRRVDPEVAIVAPHALVAIRRDAPALDPVERADRNRTADVAWRQVVCREITRVR